MTKKVNRESFVDDTRSVTRYWVEERVVGDPFVVGIQLNTTPSFTFS